MFSKEPDPEPMGVPLGELQTILQSTTLKSKLKNNCLEVSYENLTAVLTVEKPPGAKETNQEVEAIVSIKTFLPKEMQEIFSKPAFLMDHANRMATFASLIRDDEGVYLGSRLTIYKDEPGWNIYFPLLLYSLICTNEIFNHTLRYMFKPESESTEVSEVSKWTNQDFELTKLYLEAISLCNVGGLGFTAEFGIEQNDVSTVAGHQTALWRMFADQPHPVLGGGLFCILELPFSFEESTLLTVINLLNKSEMNLDDLPPHFGAWTIGNRKDNPAYVSFLPNIMHSEAKNIQVNMSMWANARVQSAKSILSLNKYI